MSDLTPTQRKALADLQRIGHLFRTGRGRFKATGTGHAPYSETTLQALVDAGAARWALWGAGHGSWPKIVPVETPVEPAPVDVERETVTVRFKADEALRQGLTRAWLDGDPVYIIIGAGTPNVRRVPISLTYVKEA